MTQRAFITYAQAEVHINEMVRGLSDKLRTGGIDARIDQYEPHPAQGWPIWMEQQFVEADRIIVVPSSTYLDRYNQSSGVGSGARFEAAILRTLLLKNGVSYEKMAVALLNKADHIYIPDLLHGCTRYVVSDDRGYEGLYRWLTNQPKILPARLGTVRKLRPKKAVTTFRALCRRLKPLFDDNHRVFRDFGPNSGADSTGPVRYNLDTWYSLRKSQIIPNNRQIRKLVVEHREVIPDQYAALFDRLVSHIDAFEVHVENEQADYREHQFPTEIVEIVDEHRK